MSHQDNFRIQLHRRYPQLATATEQLVSDYSDVLRRLEELPAGELEIEAFFGKRHYTSDSHPHFANAISSAAMSQLGGMLEGFKGWQEVEDWNLVYDYYVTREERVRVKYTADTRTVTTTRKHRLASRDFAYSSGGLPKEKEPSAWELRDHLTRVNMKLEEPRPNADIQRFESVKISVRKSFVVPSSNLGKIMFRFDLIQYWTGATVQAAERSMTTTEPTFTLETEITNAPRENVLSEKDQFLLFAGLLIKVQDFMDFPVCYQSIKQTGLLRGVQPNLCTFTSV